GPGAGGEEAAEKMDGSVEVAREFKTVLLGVDVSLSGKAKRYREVVGPFENALLVLKGYADLTNPRSRVHDLADAVQAYLKNTAEFPPGALPRAASPARGFDWRPAQRLSWAVPLLKYLGSGEYAGWNITPNLSWDEGVNLNFARRVVPHFLALKEMEAAP